MFEIFFINKRRATQKDIIDTATPKYESEYEILLDDLNLSKLHFIMCDIDMLRKRKDNK